MSAPLLLLMTIGMATAGVRARDGDAVAIDVAMTGTGALSATATDALVQAVDGIWRDAGVRINWVDAHAGGTASTPLRVLVSRRGAAAPHHEGWIVGELHRFENGEAMATASISRAEAVVRAAGSGRARGLPEAIVQHRLGTVLGRAVAHEIGHYLLESGAHAVRGLMRATFQPHEFTDLRAVTFALDEPSRRRIHARLGATLTTIVRADPGPLAGSTPSILRR